MSANLFSRDEKRTKGEVVPVLLRFEGRLLVFLGYESLMK
ncbi:hypothetical protein GCWU000325_01600 [Alloprevotella tannerae ATCC 51259]|uniref:Uncharacterized protein n=1 Tax=Alloprevotella tannerae ATCC 51259 TaxID=626522 RepID=C9LH99_9BACT|nr:hypothetical protein GCWU000325_01600 [Alloprevotella tannerae ATCC 51259]